jgi:hypothetical protein
MESWLAFGSLRTPGEGLLFYAQAGGTNPKPVTQSDRLDREAARQNCAQVIQ